MAASPYPRPNDDQPKLELNLTFAAIIIIVGVLATTMAQPQVLAKIPLQNLLKNELHVDKTANASFFFLCGLAWYFKPVAGILTDAFPIFGSRRRNYILSSALLGVLSWVLLAFTPHKYNALLNVCILINVFMVITSTVVGGYMVEIAQATSGSGRLTSVRQFVQQVIQLIQGPIAGRLAAIPFMITGFACGGILFLIVPVTIFLLHERKSTLSRAEVLGNAGNQLKNIAQAKTMWAAAGLMALFYVAPGISTAMFYKQQDVLHMSTEAQGFLSTVSGAGGITAALLYGVWCKKTNLRNLLYVCLAAGTFANFFYLYYNSIPLAQGIETFNGFGYTLAELALMDLAVRSTPKGSEGLGFSLMMSVRNLALFGTDALGSMMLEKYHWQMNWLILANCATTAITIPLVFWLPSKIVSGRDAEVATVTDIPEPKLVS